MHFWISFPEDLFTNRRRNEHVPRALKATTNTSHTQEAHINVRIFAQTHFSNEVRKKKENGQIPKYKSQCASQSVFPPTPLSLFFPLYPPTQHSDWELCLTSPTPFLCEMLIQSRKLKSLSFFHGIFGPSGKIIKSECEKIMLDRKMQIHKFLSYVWDSCHRKNIILWWRKVLFLIDR